MHRNRNYHFLFIFIKCTCKFLMEIFRFDCSSRG
nr:MAG TPA: hypothetical protein [Bacteriophage sp.]